MYLRIKKILLMLTFLISTLFSQDNSRNRINQNNLHYLTNEDYITGEDGVIRMNVNVWGKVKYPGTYLVYDNIDIVTTLSIAGGPSRGAKLSKISMIYSNGDKKIVNLKELIEKNNIQSIGLKPNDYYIY